MLVHAMAECFRLTSLCSNNNENHIKYKSQDQKFNKNNYKNHDNSKIRDVLLIKTSESKIPILNFRDYLTKSQNIKHNSLFPNDYKDAVDSPEMVRI